MTHQERMQRSGSSAWQRFGARMATLRIGRIALHMAAAVQDRQLRWHLAGIVREVVRSSVAA